MHSNPAYFLEIERCGSFSSAAKKIGITQPALSGYVSKLEEKVGALLFDRSKSPIKLTEVGELYLDYLKKSVALEDGFYRQIGDIENMKTGKITVGGAFSSTTCYLSRVTAQFIKNFPNIKINVVDGVVSEISEMALNDEVDFFITPVMKNKDRFDYIELLDERVFMCIPSGWDINKKLEKFRVDYNEILSGRSLDTEYEPINGKILCDEQFVLLGEETNIRKISEELFKSWGFAPKHSIVVSQMLTGFDLCVYGSAISFITESVLRLGNFRDFPCIYALDRKIATRKLYICRKKERYMSRACKNYIDLLKNNFC